MMKEITIFTDGASRGNPGPGGWGAIVAHGNHVNEIGGGEKKTTNNRMELTAVIEALKLVSRVKTKNIKSETIVYTDSSYVLKGGSFWVYDWQKNNWKTKTKKAVENQGLWKKFLKASEGIDIKWKLLKGHSGIPGNVRCDEIATSFADGLKPKLYSSILQNYGIDLSVKTSAKPERLLQGKTRTGKAYSYVSMVGSKIMTHKTWAQCEKRVKGVSGAKFKKSFSSEDEKLISAIWINTG
jgi:ribonuclease HI